MILSRAFAPSEREQTVVALSLCVLEHLMIDAIYIHLFEIIKYTVTIDCLSFGSMDGVWMENMHRRVCMLLCSRSMYLVLLLVLTLPRVMSNRRQAEEFSPSRRFNTDRHSQIISTTCLSIEMLCSSTPGVPELLN